MTLLCCQAHFPECYAVRLSNPWLIQRQRVTKKLYSGPKISAMYQP